jgi:hypothetical protein
MHKYVLKKKFDHEVTFIVRETLSLFFQKTKTKIQSDEK